MISSNNLSESASNFIIKTGNARILNVILYAKIEVSNLGVELARDNKRSGGSTGVVLLSAHVQHVSGLNRGGVGEVIAQTIIGKGVVSADVVSTAIHTKAQDIGAGHGVGPVVVQRNIPVLFGVTLLVGRGGLIRQVGEPEAKAVVGGSKSCDRNENSDEQGQCDNYAQGLVVLHDNILLCKNLRCLFLCKIKELHGFEVGRLFLLLYIHSNPAVFNKLLNQMRLAEILLKGEVFAYFSNDICLLYHSQRITATVH